MASGIGIINYNIAFLKPLYLRKYFVCEAINDKLAALLSRCLAGLLVYLALLEKSGSTHS